MVFYRDVNSITPTNRPDVTEIDAIVQGIKNLLRTRKTEIPFNLTFGISLKDRLFDLMDEGARLEILSDVFDSVTSFEPRVILERGISDVEFFDDDNRIEIILVFGIVGFSDENKLFTVTQSFTR